MHALLGENGAGKSTLSNILTGLYRPDEGEIVLYGEPVRFANPRDALDAGIGMVHQHFRLVETFTVAENMALGEHRRGTALARSGSTRAGSRRRSRELSERYGIDVDPRARIWQLSLGEQQRVEILKALYRDARILILDEPTAVLTPQEAEVLFATLRQMVADGRTVIFISHKLNEVKAVSDRVTVLRGGRSVATVGDGRRDAALARGADGRPRARGRRRGRPRPVPGEPMLEVDGSLGRGQPRRRRGARASRSSCAPARSWRSPGSPGNGQRELAEAIAGLRAPDAGLDPCRAARRFASAIRSAALGAGIAFVPEDRMATGRGAGAQHRLEPRAALLPRSVALARAAAPARPDPRRAPSS